jgi:hypothetical protein
MNRQHPAATLTDALLARKGTAAPTRVAPSPFDPASAQPEIVPHLVLVGRDAAPRDSAQTRFAGSGHGGLEHRRRITLRLDPTRHRRLKLAAAHLNASLQDLVIAALDSHLMRVAPGLAAGGCACLGSRPHPEEATQ